jgi:ABC-2 type transport system ATP-binding protein
MEFLEMIRGLKAEGITVLLSSHLLHQVQAVCDRVGLFDRGRLAIEGTVEDLSLRVLGGAFRIHVEVRGDGLEPALRRIAGVIDVVQERPGIYRLEARQDCRNEVARQVVTSGAQLLGLSLDRPTLDEVYARYFQEVRREA